MASFIMNYRHNKQEIKDFSKDSEEYTNKLTQDEEKNQKTLDKMVKDREKNVNIDDIEKVTPEKNKQYTDLYNKGSKTFKFKMSICDILKNAVSVSDFILDTTSNVEKGIKSIIKCKRISQNKELLRIYYPGLRKAFLQQVQFYATIEFPSIIKFDGYCITKKKQFIYIDSKEKGTLSDYISNKDNKRLELTNKLIIAYGISEAMNYLHENNIVHRNLNPSVIFLDSNLYPYLSDFYKAVQKDTYFPYLLKEINYEYRAPEFLKDYTKFQSNFGLDIYAFAMTLYYLIFEIKPYSNCSKKNTELLGDIDTMNYLPDFPIPFHEELMFWKELIIKCWDGTPSRRPNFDKICKELEEYAFNNDNIDIDAFRNYKVKFLEKL